MGTKIEILSDAAPFSMTDDWYQFASADHFWMQWRLHKIKRLIARFDAGQQIFEVGCGAGVTRKQLESLHGRAVSGCDLNQAALELAEEGDGQLYFYDIHQRRDEWNQAFSTVYLLDVLEHISDPVDFLHSVKFHLANEGLLIINVPALQWLYSRYDQTAGHVKRYSKRVLAAELEQAGFHVEQFCYWGFTMIPLLMIRKAMLRFTKKENVIRRGFQPPSKIADAILRTLMKIENTILRRPPVGTSLLAVARKID